MSFHNKYFTKKYSNMKRVLFLMAQGLFTIGSVVNYYYVESTIIKKREVILSFIEFLGAFCMLLFQYKVKWLRGTIIMCVACMVSALIFLDLLFLYIKTNTDLL